MNMTVLAKRSLFAIGFLFAAAQFVRLTKTNPPENAAHTIQVSMRVGPAVSRVLERSCADCHSDHTAWPWYSGVAPASWLVTSDVNEGRKALNLSRWGLYGDGQKAKLLTKMCEEISNGKMPMPTYLVIHRHAQMSYADTQVLCSWAQASRQDLASVTSAEADGNN
jgi:Tfp pilus assembly protein FimT